LKLRKKFARRTSIYAVCVLIFFLIIGGSILNFFGISTDIVKIAGGIIVFKSGWQTLNSEPKLKPTANKNTVAHENEYEDISFIPMTIPLSAGPGSIAITLGLAAEAGASGDFGSPIYLGVAFLVLAVIIALNSTNNNYLRMSSIVIGLVVGFLVSIPLGLVDFSNLASLPPVAIPIPFRYGFSFDFAAFIPFAFLCLITAIETIGDLTATSAISGEPIEGGKYMRRIKGGVLGDGINSIIAACLNTFPNTSFSQNNGVIQLTGVGSRYVGYFISVFFVILGLFPIIAGTFQALPQPVLGGATIVMFGTVAVAGIKILSCVNLTKRNSIILAVAMGLGLGVTFVPEILENMPALVKSIFASGISTGGITALLLNLILPGRE
jgi:xanthine permease XanP